MGVLAAEGVAIKNLIKSHREVMDEALGTSGKGPLKDQMVTEMKKANQEHKVILNGYDM
jgi:hypothetical protein